MGEHTHQGGRNPGQAFSRSRLLTTGFSATVGLALLWSAYEASYPSLNDGRVIARAATETIRNTSLRTDRSPSPTATVLPGDPLPTTTTGNEETSLTRVEPAGIANRLARLLSGTPDLDISHLSTMIGIASDPDLPAGERVVAIRWLASFGHDEAIDVLERLLLDDVTTPIRSAVATALGECPHSDATHILIALLDDTDHDVVLGAIQGLAMRDDPAATLALTALLANDHLQDEFRAAAAVALGYHDTAASNLRLALASAGGTLASGVLTGLARQPFTESESIFREMLADPNTPLDMKVEAIDALGKGTPQAADLLLELARGANDPVLRSAAIDALARFDEPGISLDALGGLVLNEPSAEVRADLYNTLSLYADQANVEPGASKLVLSTLSETTPRPQLEGYRMVASMLHDQYQSGLAETFDTNMVTWLRESAENGNDRYTRHLSVDALRLANTPGAREALHDLSRSSDPAVSGSAQKALRQLAKNAVSHVP